MRNMAMFHPWQLCLVSTALLTADSKALSLNTFILCLSSASLTCDFGGPACLFDASYILYYHCDNFTNVTDENLPITCLLL